jgi:iron complex outermembrane recepter protein
MEGMKRMKKIITTLALICALTPAGLLAQSAEQTDQSQPGVYNLGEIVVTTPKSIENSITTVNEVTSATIKEIGAQTAAEALDATPGVHFTIGGRKSDGAVMLRGLRQDRSLIMLDGIPIMAPYQHEADLAMMPIDNISKITVTKGVSSATYGANALSGVINIVTKKPELGTSATLRFLAGQNSEYSPSLSYGVNNGKVYYSVSGNYRKTDGFDLSNNFKPSLIEDGGLRLQTDLESTNAAFMVGKYDANSEYAFNFNYVDAERGTPPDTTGTSTTTNKATLFNRFTTWKKWTADLSGEQMVTQNTKLREKLYFHKYDNVLTSYDDYSFTHILPTIISGVSYDNISTFDDYTMGFRILTDTNVNDSTLLKASLNYNRENHKKEAYPGYAQDHYVTDNYSLGAEVEKAINQRLTFTAGASYDTMDQKSGEEAVSATSTAKIDMQGAAHAFSPMAGLVYNYNDYTTLHLSLGVKTRFPTQFELFSDTLHSGTKWGNQDLEPEKNTSVEAGYDIRFDSGLKLGATYFYNGVKDYIDCVGTGVFVGGKEICQYVNQLKMNSKGFELTLGSKFKSSTEWSFGHTHTIARVVSPTSDPAAQMDYTPKGQTEFSLKRRFSDSISLDILSSYTTTTRDSFAKSTQVIKPYFLMNAGVSGDCKKSGVEWNVFVDNVFDKNYWEEVGYPRPGRTLRGELEYSF